MAAPRIDQAVTFLYVSDLERSHRFYTEVIGLELVLDQGMCRIYRVTPTAFLGVCHDPQRAGSTDGVIVTLVTDAVAETFQRIASAGARVEATPGHNTRFNIYHALVLDPDGYRIEIQQFRDPAWPRAAD